MARWTKKRHLRIKMRYYFFRSLKEAKDQLIRPYFRALNMNRERALRKQQAVVLYHANVKRYYLTVVKLFGFRRSHYRETSAYLSQL